MTKRKLEALGKVIIKAAKKNAAPPDGDYFSGLECNELFLETLNPIWIKLMNKNGDIPSGVQIVDLRDQVRREAFEIKDAQRRVYLEASRKRAAQKRCDAMHPFRIIGFVGRNGYMHSTTEGKKRTGR